MYAQPLVAGGCLFAATEDDSVYAFSATTGALRWRTHLATPVAGGLPCGDISPSGITGTPVLDPVNGSLWVVVLTSGAAGPVHQAVELRSSNGQVERRQAFALPGREPAAEQERGALALEDGNLYIPLGGLFGDCNNYDGGVVSVPEAGGHSPGYWEVPTARGAGMWEPSGIDILANGELLIADGNGAAAPGQSFDGSNAVVELSPALKTERLFCASQLGATQPGRRRPRFVRARRAAGRDGAPGRQSGHRVPGEHRPPWRCGERRRFAPRSAVGRGRSGPTPSRV